MAIHVEAIYEHAVPRPLEPLALAEHQLVRVTVEERRRPLSADLVPQPDNRRDELDWPATESRQFAGEWIAFDGNRLFAHELNPVAVKAAAQAVGVFAAPILG